MVLFKRNCKNVNNECLRGFLLIEKIRISNHERSRDTKHKKVNNLKHQIIF